MYIADLHIHSKYSRATSKELEPEPLDAWARRKGIGLVGTGDFTHPAWRAELRDKLAEAEEGLYTLKGAGPDAPRFVITGEISSIYKKNGKVRKVHSLILLPHLEAAETLSRRLEALGNLHSDGRPICWRSPWSPALMRCSSPLTSGRPTSPCSGPSPALTPSGSASAISPAISTPWRPGSPLIPQ